MTNIKVKIQTNNKKILQKENTNQQKNHELEEAYEKKPF